MDNDARFANLRAEGAFLVSSELKDGQVQYVSILSEKGGPCTFVNPWPGQDVHLVCDGKDVEILTGQRVTFPTHTGERILLKTDA